MGGSAFLFFYRIAHRIDLSNSCIRFLESNAFHYDGYLNSSELFIIFIVRGLLARGDVIGVQL